ncbi:unnamed protein product [Blepharisma stoltei]|uniref:PPM-type phosphatase domain-containing protein n=1 Tax=Blepharisma stoltei TaxID=1481888 RepID=A0AAU9K5U7_9CILI|nr:unnamed protein product [Blepharisma stoltei]
MGQKHSLPKKAKHSNVGESPRMKFGAADTQGFRNSMQDSRLMNLLLDQRTSVFGVFDGHRGHEVSEFVAKHFCTEIKKTKAYNKGRIRDALEKTFIRMDDLLRTPEGQKELHMISKGIPNGYPIDKIDPIMSGCTAVVALIRDDKLYVANAGDSRCILSRKGKAIEMTVDHKPELPEEHERIINAGGTVLDGRVMGNLNLSRSIGDLDFKANADLPHDKQMIISVPDITEVTLTKQDHFILLACDGVWDLMTSQEAVEFVDKKLKKKKPIGDVAEDLLDNCFHQAVKAQGSDNMTVIVVAFKHPLNV